MDKEIYCIWKESFEFDDPCLSSSERPIFFTTDKDQFNKTWNEIKQKEIEHFNKFKEESVDPDYKADYTIETNTDDELTLYMGNWSYRWWKMNYEMDKLYFNI